MRSSSRALALIISALVAVSALAGCAGQPATAGNAALNFQVAVQTGDYGRAYSLLCPPARARMTADQFAAARPAEIQAFVSLASTVGTRAQFEPLETTKDEVKDAWVEFEGQRSGSTETWRLGLVREDGAWKVCTFEKTAARAAPPDTNFSPTTQR